MANSIPSTTFKFLGSDDVEYTGSTLPIGPNGGVMVEVISSVSIPGSNTGDDTVTLPVDIATNATVLASGSLVANAVSAVNTTLASKANDATVIMVANAVQAVANTLATKANDASVLAVATAVASVANNLSTKASDTSVQATTAAINSLKTTVMPLANGAASDLSVQAVVSAVNSLKTTATPLANGAAADSSVLAVVGAINSLKTTPLPIANGAATDLSVQGVTAAINSLKAVPLPVANGAALDTTVVNLIAAVNSIKTASLPIANGAASDASVQGITAAVNSLKTTPLPVANGAALDTSIQGVITAINSLPMAASVVANGASLDSSVQATTAAINSLKTTPLPLANGASSDASVLGVTAAINSLKVTPLPAANGVALDASVLGVTSAINSLKTTPLPVANGAALDTSIQGVITSINSLKTTALPAANGVALDASVQAVVSAVNSLKTTATPASPGVSLDTSVTAVTAAVTALKTQMYTGANTVALDTSVQALIGAVNALTLKTPALGTANAAMSQPVTIATGDLAVLAKDTSLAGIGGQSDLATANSVVGLLKNLQGKTPALGVVAAANASPVSIASDHLAVLGKDLTLNAISVGVGSPSDTSAVVSIIGLSQKLINKIPSYGAASVSNSLPFALANEHVALINSYSQAIGTVGDAAAANSTANSSLVALAKRGAVADDAALSFGANTLFWQANVLAALTNTVFNATNVSNTVNLTTTGAAQNYPVGAMGSIGLQVTFGAGTTGVITVTSSQDNGVTYPIAKSVRPLGTANGAPISTIIASGNYSVSVGSSNFIKIAATSLVGSNGVIVNTIQLNNQHYVHPTNTLNDSLYVSQVSNGAVVSLTNGLPIVPASNASFTTTAIGIGESYTLSVANNYANGIAVVASTPIGSKYVQMTVPPNGSISYAMKLTAPTAVPNGVITYTNSTPFPFVVSEAISGTINMYVTNWSLGSGLAPVYRYL